MKKRIILLCPHCGTMMEIEVSLPEKELETSTSNDSKSIVVKCIDCKNTFTVDLRPMSKKHVAVFR